MKYNPSDKCKKYIVVGRKQTVKNHDPEGEDRVRMTTEIFVRKPNTTMRGSTFIEYERAYFKDFTKGGRGVDVGKEEGQMYVSVDGTIGDFVDFVCPNNEHEQNEVRACKTYANRNFIKRDRETTFHEEVTIGIDPTGRATILDEEDSEDVI
jgi:hypothetical protein